MNLTKYFVGSLVAVAAVFAVGASDTYACPKPTPKPTPAPTSKPCDGTCPTSPKVKDGINWTSLNMNQKQGVVGNSKPVNMKQNAVGHTATFFGSEAMSSSKHFANQELNGAPTKAQQAQGIVSGARTEFQANKTPSWVTAGTMGTVAQNQNAWSATPINMKQAAGTEQKGQVGESKSLVQGQEEQVLTGATGDPYQNQKITGSSQTQGYANTPFPQIYTFGSQFRQQVNFSVDNIFSF